MNPRRCLRWAPVVALLIAAAALAQDAPKAAPSSPPTVEKVRLGLGDGGEFGGVTRNGRRAPVVVTLRGGKTATAAGEFDLLIESTDQEEMPYRARVPLPAIPAEAAKTVRGYVAPGNDSAVLRVSVAAAGGEAATPAKEVSRELNRANTVRAEDILYLTAGAQLKALESSAEKLDRPDGKNVVDLDSQGKRRFVVIGDAAGLPDRAAGYDAVDLVVLTSGSGDKDAKAAPTRGEEMVRALSEPDAADRRAALLDWVRGGGRLVLSVGKNAQAVAALLDKMPLVDCKVADGDVVPAMTVTAQQWSGRELHKAALTNVRVAALSPGPRADVLVAEGKRPVVVQSPCGMGRVVLVGFDLDAPPFANWDGAPAFWARLQKEVAPFLAVDGRQEQVPGRRGRFNRNADFDADTRDYAVAMKRGLESFEEVPSVSFGWVALFLLAYILLVGPIDYFILKRFVKRLELTWVTFPLLVVGVSAAAYLSARAVKGDELRANKIDVVDFDYGNPQRVYGRTLFTLFSPRVASYAVGLEPAGGAFTAGTGARVALGLLETGEQTLRLGGRSAFRKPYEVGPAGLSGVPIPVWSTRTFDATWDAAPPAVPALGVTDENGPPRLAREGRAVVGRVTNNLAVPMNDVVMFWRDKWYTVGTLQPGESKRLEGLFAVGVVGQNREMKEFFTGGQGEDGRAILAPGLPLAPSGRPINANFRQERSAYQLVKPLMFFAAAEHLTATNSSLRALDQTWRVRQVPSYPAGDGAKFRDEVVFVARTPMLCDAAESVAAHGASATRLWLGALPGPGADRPAMPGVVTQETYLRFVVPLAAVR